MNAVRRFYEHLTGLTDLCHALALAEARAEAAEARQQATMAQLETSRLEHGIALQKVEASEMALIHLHERIKRERRKRRATDRTWIARQIAPRVTEN